jgi:hypothetical protein
MAEPAGFSLRQKSTRYYHERIIDHQVAGGIRFMPVFAFLFWSVVGVPHPRTIAVRAGADPFL